MNGPSLFVRVLIIERWIWLSFFHHLHSHTPIKEDTDMLMWRLNRLGMFDSHSYYHALRAHTELSFLWRNIWEVKAPRRVSFFVCQSLGVGF